MTKKTIAIHGGFIRLDHLLQLAGLAGSGGEGGSMILAGLVAVNGVKASEKRKKIFPGDRVVWAGKTELTVEAEKNAHQESATL
jgi:ribosome-associated protein